MLVARRGSSVPARHGRGGQAHAGATATFGVVPVGSDSLRAGLDDVCAQGTFAVRLGVRHANLNPMQ